MIFYCWTDEDLAKINLRDPEVFKRIYLKYSKKIYNYLMLKTGGNKDIAEEIFCRTFHSALESAPKLKNTDNILGWLMQIASRRFSDFLRNQYKEEKYLHKIYEEKISEIEPVNDMITREEILMFNMAIDKIPELSKRALILKYLENKSQKEISVILNKSEKAVESLLSRSKKLLKKELVGFKRFFYE